MFGGKAGNGTTQARRHGGHTRGFSAVELVAVVGLAVTLVGIAIPSFREAVERRQVTDGAAHVAAFVEQLRSDAVAAGRAFSLSFAHTVDGGWCAGAMPGTAPCDCAENDPRATNYCLLEGDRWTLRSSEQQFSGLDVSFEGPGRLVYHPENGVSGAAMLEIGAASGRYRLRLGVQESGNLDVCVVQSSPGIRGFRPCHTEVSDT